MAVYEFFCPQCRNVFEVMRPMSQADSPTFCPQCKKQGEKLLSVFASTADFSIKVPDKEPFRKKSKNTRARKTVE